MPESVLNPGKVGWSPWLQTPLLSLSLKILFIYVLFNFIAMRGLSLAAVSEGYPLVGVRGFSLQ